MKSLNKELKELSKGEFEELLRVTLRRHLGDKIENKTRIWARNGFWFLKLPINKKTKHIAEIWNNLAFRRYSLKALAVQLAEIEEQ